MEVISEQGGKNTEEVDDVISLGEKVAAILYGPDNLGSAFTKLLGGGEALRIPPSLAQKYILEFGGYISVAQDDVESSEGEEGLPQEYLELLVGIYDEISDGEMDYNSPKFIITLKLVIGGLFDIHDKITQLKPLDNRYDSSFLSFIDLFLELSTKLRYITHELAGNHLLSIDLSYLSNLWSDMKHSRGCMEEKQK